MDFTGFKEELEKVKELMVKLKWSKAQKEKQTKDPDEKQEAAKTKEIKRLDALYFLKSLGEPVTVERDVKEYLAKENMQEKQRAKRMKVEWQQA